jgi:hypothetical protein
VALSDTSKEDTMTKLTHDQRRLVELCEAIYLALPIETDEEFEALADPILDELEARGAAIRGEAGFDIETVGKYRAGLERDGFNVAADGLGVLIDRYRGELALKFENAPRN